MFWTSKAGPKPGDAAPPFTLPDERGTAVTLTALRGKKRVILAFYPQDDTPG